MAKNVDHIQHIKSNVVLEGKPKLPQPGSLVEGELAINYAEGVETISIKNSSGDIVTFSSDDYYSKQKLGSAFTDANSAVTVTEYIEENELIVSTALNDLKENKLDASAYTPTDLSNYYTKSETSGATELSTEFELYVQKTDVDKVLDNTTSASTNPVSSKAVYDAVTDNELVWTNAYVTMSGVVSSHTVDSSIHVTSSDKDDWNDAVSKSHTHDNKTYLDGITGNVGTMAYQNTNSYSSATQVNTALADKASTGDIANFFDDAKYEDSGTTKVINFYHGNTRKATIDATDFIKDGMIDTVSAGTSGSTTVLVITWNTDAGKSQTILDIGDMFEADNYYTKSETSGATELSTAFSAKANTATTLAGYDITDAYTKTYIDDKLGTGFTVSSITEVIESNERVTASALNDLNTNKLDVSAYTPTDLSNYYTKSETSGATELSTAFGVKVDSSTFTAHTASTVHMNNTEKTNLDSLATNIAAISGITSTKVGNWDTAYTNNHTHSNKTALNSITGNVGTMAYQATSSYSSATQVNTALEGKVSTTDIVTAITTSNSGSTNPIATKVIAENERVTANALTDLDERKLDVSAYTPTDLSNYYTKSETSGATEISNALGGKVNSATFTGHTADTTAHITAAERTSWNNAVNGVTDLSGQSETIAAALVDLNTNKLDASALSGYATKSGDLDGVVLKKITQSAYDALVQAGTVDPNTLYIITD